jgi:hypothetical protein
MVSFGLILTAAALGWVSTSAKVYYTQAYVVFLAPSQKDQPNTYRNISSSLIATAAIIGREINGPVGPPQPVSDGVTIVDLGLNNGHLVRLPNSGGQWAYNYDRPVLDVQAAGPTAERARETLKQTVGLIRTTLDTRQQALGVPRAQMIDMTLSPPAPPVFEAQGSRSRALLATLVLGLVGTVASAVWVDLRMVRRMIREKGRGSR